MNKVPFVDYGQAYRNQKVEIDSAIQNCLNEGQVILRDEVEKFEQTIADYVGAKYAVGVNSGSDALWLSLLAVGVGRGDEVIVPSHTFAATIQAVELALARPVFVDVGDDELMDVDKIEESITEFTKAIIPVHLTGKVADMERINAIAEKYDLRVIEDAAQALGASKIAGDTMCFSMYPFKILGTAGDAGMIATNDEKIYEELKLLRNHGNVSQTGIDLKDGTKAKWGWNSRLDNIHAAILNVRFKQHQRNLDRRKEFGEMYTAGLQGLPITLPTEQEGRVYQEYVIQAMDRNALADYLEEQGVEVLPNKKDRESDLKPIHLSREPELSLPQTDFFTRYNLRLPLWPDLTPEQIKYVIEKIREHYGV